MRFAPSVWSTRTVSIDAAPPVAARRPDRPYGLLDGSVVERQYSRDHGPGRNRERDVRMALQLIVEACNRTGRR